MRAESFGLAFHHLGLAVSESAKAAQFLEGLGYAIGEAVRDDLQNVNLIMCTSSNMPAVEVIFPTSTPGPLASVLASRKETIYHICYQTSNADHSIQQIKAAGIRVRLLSAPKPAILFGNCPVSFHYVVGFGIIELVETPPQSLPKVAPNVL